MATRMLSEIVKVCGFKLSGQFKLSLKFGPILKDLSLNVICTVQFKENKSLVKSFEGDINAIVT